MAEKNYNSEEVEKEKGDGEVTMDINKTAVNTSYLEDKPLNMMPMFM